jgi:hypothetical protein
VIVRTTKLLLVLGSFRVTLTYTDFDRSSNFNHLPNRKQNWLAALCLALAATVFGVCSTSHAQQSLQVMHKHVPPAVSGGQATLISELPAEQSVNSSIVLPLRNENELTKLLSRLYDPSSPDYHHFLSVEEFTEEFGPTADDYHAVVSFVQANDIRVTDTPRNRLVVPITGSVARINKAFNLTMQVYRHPTTSGLLIETRKTGPGRASATMRSEK